MPLLKLALISPLFQSRGLCLGNGGTHSELDLPTSIILDSLHRHTHNPTHYRQPLMETVFAGDSRLCQVGKANSPRYYLTFSKSKPDNWAIKFSSFNLQNDSLILFVVR